ncbi:Aste57867_4169 [Aphanomyces stellatus]|uniref:Aste57867_4169 protein n=1 Tax=Aphanomyces stellatus TaxID=120398 RepID=A0A485KF17_9STRA|nr:hypothetical protein As57867_004158 [Aphanomyces stellatus]VFT81295.1 Aste57867_4169 [Aphanomyces stellatus]
MDSEMDDVALIMAGLVTFHWRRLEYLFDLKLWILRSDLCIPPALSSTQVMSRSLSSGKRHLLDENVHLILKHLGAGLGVLYALLAIVGSVSYFHLSSVNMANDMFWANYNMTGTHVFIADWLNEQLILGVSNMTFAMDIDEINQNGPFDQTSANVQSAGNFGALMQYSQLNTIEATISGLRSTDAAAVPWIFTQYCFLDFGQQWELANSATRLQRCKSNMTSNGAVFMESILRNINFHHFYEAVGRSFDVAITNELRQSSAGLKWLGMVSNPMKAPLADEWQNFKRIGLVNTYTVTNMYGSEYPFTLQYGNSSFRQAKQSTHKMYWGFANDLAALTQNGSGITGLSLIRIRNDAEYYASHSSCQ